MAIPFEDPSGTTTAFVAVEYGLFGSPSSWGVVWQLAARKKNFNFKFDNCLVRIILERQLLLSAAIEIGAIGHGVGSHGETETVQGRQRALLFHFLLRGDGLAGREHRFHLAPA